MSSDSTNIFARQLLDLTSVLNSEWAWPSVEAGFGWYVFRSLSEVSPLPDAASVAWPSKESLLQAPALASTGYLMFIRPLDAGSVQLADWLDGAKRLSERKAFPADRQSFAYRPLEVLGISVGLLTCGESAAHLIPWFREVIERLIKETDDSDVWSQSLLALVAAELAITFNRQVNVTFDLVSPDILALLRWLSAIRPKLTFLELLNARLALLDPTLLRRLATASLPSYDLARTTLLYASLRNAVNDHIESSLSATWQIGKQTQDAAKLIEILCRRFHLFVMQIAMRHNGRGTIVITDEYDVQDAMHALLKLFFDDVRAEEVSPSYAGKSTRMDFILKREKIVIETKMTRKSLDQNGVANELIEDKQRYRTHPDFQTLICLVYDPTHICKSPTALENDVSGQDGKFQCLVIVTPKGM